MQVLVLAMIFAREQFYVHPLKYIYQPNIYV